MQKIKFRFITLTLILSITPVLPAFVTQNTSDRASEQLGSYFMDTRDAGNGEIIITFSVDRTRKMEQIGAKRIVVLNRAGGVWSIVESWSEDDSDITTNNAYYYGNTMYFDDKVGIKCRVDITVFTENSSDSGSKTQTFFVTTWRAKAGASRLRRAFP